MATVTQFEDLQVWQDARVLVREVYRVTKQRVFKGDFGLRDQITRAATSTMSNIAEGFERGSRNEFIQFLHIAKASNGEVRSQLYIGLDREYFDKQTFDELREAALVLFRRLTKFINCLKTVRSNSRRSGGLTPENLQPSTFNLQPLIDHE
jgi:four helix bundle protein